MKQIVILLIPLLFFGLSGCSKPGDDEQAAQPAASTDTAKQPEAVKIMEIRLQTIPRLVTYATTLMAAEEVHLASAVPGRIEKINVEVGARVTKGQELIRMDKTQLQQSQIQLENLRADLERLETLRKVGSVTAQQYDQLKTQVAVASAAYDALKQNTQLGAPFDGIITGKYFENGEMFTGTPNTSAGKAAIVSLASVDTMKAQVAVSEKYCPYITNKTPLLVSTEVYGQETFTGEVLRLHPCMDPLTRTFITEISIANPARKLRPGMSARVTLTLDTIEALMVPASAILKLRGSNERYIFIAKEGRAQRVVVELGRRYNENVEIISDKLNPGDQLIIAGQNRLLDGDPIAIHNN